MKTVLIIDGKKELIGTFPKNTVSVGSQGQMVYLTFGNTESGIVGVDLCRSDAKNLYAFLSDALKIEKTA